jgi:hypothetical protein
VVRILLKVVDDLSMDEAVSIMQTAHEQGVSVVVTVAQQVRCLSTTNTSECFFLGSINNTALSCSSLRSTARA